MYYYQNYRPRHPASAGLRLSRSAANLKQNRGKEYCAVSKSLRTAVLCSEFEVDVDTAVSSVESFVGLSCVCT